MLVAAAVPQPVERADEDDARASGWHISELVEDPRVEADAEVLRAATPRRAKAFDVVRETTSGSGRTRGAGADDGRLARDLTDERASPLARRAVQRPVVEDVQVLEVDDVRAGSRRTWARRICSASASSLDARARDAQARCSGSQSTTTSCAAVAEPSRGSASTRRRCRTCVAMSACHCSAYGAPVEPGTRPA